MSTPPPNAPRLGVSTVVHAVEPSATAVVTYDGRPHIVVTDGLVRITIFPATDYDATEEQRLEAIARWCEDAGHKAMDALDQLRRVAEVVA